MKVDVMRLSGDPVNRDDIQACRDEWRALYDKIEAHCKHPKTNALDMLRVQKLCKRLEPVVLKKYKVVVEWDFIDNEEGWQARIKEYGGILVTKNMETQKMVYVIADIDLRMGGI